MEGRGHVPDPGSEANIAKYYLRLYSVAVSAGEDSNTLEINAFC